MTGKAPHIVQYQGSKRVLAPQILRYIPCRFNRFIEPFAGMAAMTIAVAQEHRTNKFVINDFNTPLVGILKSAIEQPELLYEDYKLVWQAQFDFEGGSVSHYYHMREEFNRGNKSPAIMLYLLARCVKGAVRYNSAGEFNQSPDKRRNGTNPETLLSNIMPISRCLKGKTSYFSCDYREILALAREGDVVYMDPPYQGVSGTRDSRYVAGVDFKEFVDQVEHLVNRGIDFLISYDGSCGEISYGEDLPLRLGLKKVLLNAGLSTQKTLLGQKATTFEALYISPGLIGKTKYPQIQTSLFDTFAI